MRLLSYILSLTKTKRLVSEEMLILSKLHSLVSFSFALSVHVSVRFCCWTTRKPLSCAFIMEDRQVSGPGHTGPTGINESRHAHGKLTSWCVATAVYTMKKWENLHIYRYKLNCSILLHIRNYQPNVLHLSQPSSSLDSTMCRFLALYTKARFYLLRHLSIEVNVDYIKLLINMEKCIVPEILNQPPQQRHWKHHKNSTYFWFK